MSVVNVTLPPIELGAVLPERLHIEQLLAEADGYRILLADDRELDELVLCVVAISEDALEAALTRGAAGRVVRRERAGACHLVEVAVDEQHVVAFGDRLFAYPSTAFGLTPASQEQKPAALQLGVLFAGRYRIASLIGRGGMGEVYRAYDEVLQRIVALKIVCIHGADSDREELGRRLMKEARLVAGLKHPHIVEIYDAGESGGRPYLVFELCEGGNLRHAIEARAASREDRLRWMQEIAEALAFAHARGIIHRDIKPENVVVTGSGVAKLVDFGIAKALAPHAHALPLTLGITGTPRYMAPEQLLANPLDARADQFTWALVAYELWTGTPFPRGATDDRALRAALCDEAPSGLADILAKALSTARERRFSTMRDVVERLAALSLVPRSAQVSRPQFDRNELSSSNAALQESVRGRPRWRTWGALLSVSAAFAAATIGLSLRAHAVDNASGATTSASATSGMSSTIRSADLAASTSRASEAMTMFRSGQQRWRDASLVAARDKFAEAATLDSSLASAHVRYVAVSEWVDPSVREHLRRASDLRSSLEEKDRLLLDALTPSVVNQADLGTTLRRLSELKDRFPDDFEVRGALALRLVHAHRLDQALREATVLSSASGAALGEYISARVLLERDDSQGARAALDACRRRSPGAGDCMELSIRIAENEGDCTLAESESRRFIDAEPEVGDAHVSLAAALAGLERSPDEVHSALEQRWARQPAPERALSQCQDEGLVWAMRGEFRRADDSFRQCESAAITHVDAHRRGYPLLMRWRIANELNDVARKTELAKAYVAASALWLPNEVHDPSIEGYQLLRMSGAMTAREFARVRDGWLAEPLPPGHYLDSPGARWYEAYARAAVAREEANTALGHIPTNRPLLPGNRLDPHVNEGIGEVYLLAGKVDAALPILTRAARACSITDIFSVMHARYLVGTIHERKGDRDGACAAYRSVLSRWRPESGSASARASQRRFDALRCDRDVSTSKKDVISVDDGAMDAGVRELVPIQEREVRRAVGGDKSVSGRRKDQLGAVNAPSSITTPEGPVDEAVLQRAR